MESREKLLAEGSDAEPMAPAPEQDAPVNRDGCRVNERDGFSLDELKVGDSLELVTKNRTYLLENRGNGEILIFGHPKYCPQPTLVRLYGSTAGWTAVKPGFIGRGMYLEFRHPEHGLIRTSRVEQIRVPKPRVPSGSELLASAV
jgi:hypothetical protein